MAQIIKHKRSSSAGAVPSVSALVLGEIALNTNDGKMFFKKDVSGSSSIVEVITEQGGDIEGSLTFGQSGKISFPDITTIPDTPTNQQADFITFGSGGSISQVTGRVGLMLTSSDDALVLANGDVGKNFTSSNINVVSETIYMLSDFDVKFYTGLQDGWGGGATYTPKVTTIGTDGTISSANDGNSTNWKEAYDNYITGIAVSGSSTKTITLTQRDGGTITANFTDIDTNTNTTYTGSKGIALSGTDFRIKGNEIPGSTNLNDYRATGFYAQNANADAASGSNYPVDKAGILQVINDDYGNGLHTTQLYSEYNSTRYYIRTYYSGSWQAWRDLSQDTNTNTTYTAGKGISLSSTQFNLNVSATTQSAAAVALTATTNRTYAIQTDASDNLVVNVPWADTNTNTTYTAGIGLSLSSTQFNVNVSATTQSAAAVAVSNTTNRTYAIQVDASDSLVVNVPWTDTNTNSFNSLTSKTSGTGDYATTGDLQSGKGSGGVALTINDGKGNANVTWNHQNGVPEQNGNAARIEVNTDSTTGAKMYFELKSSVSSGVSVDLQNIMTLGESAITAESGVSFAGNGSGLTDISYSSLTGAPSIPSPANDATISLSAGTYLSGGGSFTTDQAANETITFNHSATSRSDTSSSFSVAHGGSLTIVDSVTTNTEGHVTKINVNTVTLPGDNNTTYALTAAQTGGTDVDPNLFLNGSSGTDYNVQLAGSGGTTVTRNSNTQVTFSSIDTAQGVARGMGWEGTYGADSAAVAETAVRWNYTEKCVEIQSDADTTLGAAFRAVRVKAGDVVRFTVTAKGDVASSAGFYLRLYQYNGNLPDGKTHVANNTAGASPFVQEDSSGDTGWIENQAVPVAWTTYEKDYTAPADGYVSLVILNWSGHGTNSLFIRQPDIQFQKVNEATSANIWTTSRTNTVTLTGDVTGTGSASVNGSSNWTVSLSTVVLNDSHSHSTYVLKSGDTMTGNLTLSKSAPLIRLYDSNAVTGSYPAIEFDTANNQGIGISFNEFDAELPLAGYGLVVGPSTTNTQFPTTGDISFNVLGEIYTGGETLSSLNKVFHDGYHPNADRWTTSRTNTVTLTGNVTGTGSASVNGSGNWTVSVSTILATFNGLNRAVDFDFDGNGSVSAGDALAYQKFAYGIVTGTDLSNVSTIEPNWNAISSSSGAYTDCKFRIMSVRGSYLDALKRATGSNVDGNGDTTIIGNVEKTSASTQLIAGVSITGDIVNLIGNTFATSLSATNLAVPTTGTFAAPFMDDANNSAYFIDPSSTVTSGRFAGDLKLDDNAQIRLGTGEDFQLYHTGSNSYIDDQGVGSLNIRSTNGTGVYITDGSSNYMASFLTGGATSLYYLSGGSSAVKLATSASGVSITGNLIASGDVTAYSDKRLKENIQTLDGSKVFEMRGVSYKKDGREGSGVVAQELEKIAPELVTDGEFKSVAYGNLVGYLIEAVKDLKAEIEELKAERIK